MSRRGIQSTKLQRGCCLLVLTAASLVNGQDCEVLGGAVDPETGECKVCVSDQNCCILNTQDFSLNCDPYCTIIDGTTHCGTAACVSSISETACEGTIVVEGSDPIFPTSNTLDLQWTCDVTGTCSCTEAKWDSQPCAQCSFAGEGYDCTAVGGPCVGSICDGDVAGDTNATATTVPPPVEIPRPYRTDEDFLASIELLGLVTASNDANVPIGAAIGDGEVSINLMQTYVPSDFNMIVAENAMKWNKLLADETVLGVYDYTAADEMVDYAVSVGARVRGHTLVWGRFPGETYPLAVETEIESSPQDATETLTRIMRDHITDVAQHFAGKVGVWDVVNEHLTSRIPENVFYDVLGDDYVKTAFQIAREALPDETVLVWNEALSDFKLDNPDIEWWLSTLAQYKDEGVPIDGIGVQGHSILKQHNTEDLALFLQTVAEMGYFVELTEVDAQISLFSESADPFQAQGEYFKEYAAACLASGGCAGITFWGLTDSFTWYDTFFPNTKPNLPLLIDEEGFRKPGWTGVRDALMDAVLVEEGGDPIFLNETNSSIPTALPLGQTTLAPPPQATTPAPPPQATTPAPPQVTTTTSDLDDGTDDLMAGTDDLIADGNEPMQPTTSTPYPSTLPAGGGVLDPIWQLQDTDLGGDSGGALERVLDFFTKLWELVISFFMPGDETVEPGPLDFDPTNPPSLISQDPLEP